MNENVGRTGLPEFRVPVTVFTTVHAVDARDAAAIAETVVQATLHSAAVAGEPADTLQADLPRVGTVSVRVHQVLDTATAARNGHLSVGATLKAYQELS